MGKKTYTSEYEEESQKKLAVTFGKRLKKVLKDNKVSQRELASCCKVTAGAMSKYINGNYLPTTFILVRIAIILNISVDYLLGFSEDPRTIHHRTRGRAVSRDSESISKFANSDKYLEVLYPNEEVEPDETMKVV